ncbi:MAG: hypothetical protein JXR25_16560 [Pontiellaceae bacterium]|nr:hypothetical protein [Pontiellaceae bacterium]
MKVSVVRWWSWGSFIAHLMHLFAPVGAPYFHQWNDSSAWQSSDDHLPPSGDTASTLRYCLSKQVWDPKKYKLVQK